MIVVDASVAVKWFLPEAGSDAAQTILGGAEKLIAPALIRIEVAAAVTRKTRLGELDAEEAEAACRLWFAALARGVITVSPDEANLQAAVQLALKLKHPLQDCLYLAVAQRVDARLLTADRRFSVTARKHYAAVELLTQ